MGRIYKRMNQPGAAMVHFTHALDLKPSSADANTIKAAIETLTAAEASDGEEDADAGWNIGVDRPRAESEESD